jgi:decaprenyl-phosphate phosphoribosyltransferase
VERKTIVVIRALIATLRPRQWIKNLLVLAVPLAAGRLFESSVLQNAAIAFVAFLFASWFIYLINDVRDRHSDALHPIKALRPIAAGTLPLGVAISFAAFAAMLAIVVATAFGTWELALTVCAYIILQLGYQFGLKQVMLIDVAIIAAGFILRAVAGGTATALPISNWFLTVTASVAMFVVSSKRYSEFKNQNGSGETRKVLLQYSESYLRLLWSASMLSSIIFYSLWSVEVGASLENLYAQFSVIPFSLIILKYAHYADNCDAESPERVVLRDRTIQFLVAVWLMLFIAQVY